MNTVLFDLDGTLLPMDNKEFIDTYMFFLKNRLLSADYEADMVIGGIWAGFKAMVSNDGMITNEECFWKAFGLFMTSGEGKLDSKQKRKIEKEMNKFYAEDFGMARYVTRPSDIACECVQILKDKGYQLAIATNPVFPQIATYECISWAGLNPDDFSLITTYENSCYSKPNVDYYKFVMKMLDKDPEDCLMVGNDVGEDMCARKTGMDVFLLNECLINEKEEDVSELKQGSWKLFKEYISNLPSLV